MDTTLTKKADSLMDLADTILRDMSDSHGTTPGEYRLAAVVAAVGSALCHEMAALRAETAVLASSAQAMEVRAGA